MKRGGSFFLVGLALAAVVVQVTAQNNSATPLSIARQGYIFAGGKYSTTRDQPVMNGQLFAEFQIPAKQTHQWPIVMVHGGGQSGTNFTGTPDGREGWAQLLLRRGYAVYVVDQPGRGRAAYEPDAYGPTTRVNFDNIERRFVAPERFNLWPQAHLHTQWPGRGMKGDPIFDQFYASQLPAIQDFTLQQILNRDALLALLDQIGPSILLTHSQSSAFGWPVADARPDLVKAHIAVEPNGPPFRDVENVGAPDWFRDATVSARPWGLTADPLVYSPLAADATELIVSQQDKPDASDLVRCWTQRAPARTLPNLTKVPVLILTGEASYHAAYDHCTVKYLQQAGIRPAWIRLADVGIRGNGHMMMLEKNSAEIATLMSNWLDDTLPRSSKSR